MKQLRRKWEAGAQKMRSKWEASGKKMGSRCAVVLGVCIDNQSFRVLMGKTKKLRRREVQNCLGATGYNKNAPRVAGRSAMG